MTMRYLLILLFLFPKVGSGQVARKVDFKTCEATIGIDFSSRTVSGHVSYTFEVLSKTDTIKIDAVNMQFQHVEINGKPVKYKATAKTLDLYTGFRKGKNIVYFNYTATPKQTLYFFGEQPDEQIWTQGQGKYTSHWLPSFDDVNEKVVFNLSVTYDKNFTVISNGVLKGKTEAAVQTQWQYEMQQPMSSYLVMLAIGKFAKRTETAASGIELEQYYSLGDEARVEPTYRYSKQIFDFLEREIGVAYPWQIYKQVPVRDFLYAGMENTSATTFAQDFVVDSIGFNDKNYINVNAHELAHQWFGDLVTAKSGKHHWLQEGFATYYALLAERDVFGEDYFYEALYDMAEELQQASRSDTVPILNEKASALSFYKKGAWALHVLRENVGEKAFRLAVRNYLDKYKFRNVDTDEFLAEVAKASKYDLIDFRRRWLENPNFEIGEAVALLRKNTAIGELLNMGQPPYEPAQWQDVVSMYTGRMTRTGHSRIQQESLYDFAAQHGNKPFEDKILVYRAALATGDLKVRQVVAQTIGNFPESFYPEYVTLLDDKSYITQEIAAGTLWKLFPDKRKELLDETKGRVGFNDKNLRIQWLTMALALKDYEPSEKVTYYDELLGYTTPRFESSVRQNALQNLIYLSAGDTNMLKALVNPLVHHKWQFQKFAREKIREFLKHDQPRKFYEKLLPELPENERVQLKRLLDEK